MGADKSTGKDGWMGMILPAMAGEDEADIFDRETVAIHEQHVRVAHLMRPGTRTYKEIGDLLSISPATVCRIVKDIRRWYHDLAQASYQDHIARLLHKIHHAQDAAWKAWEKSTGDAQETTSAQRGTPAGQQSSTSVKKKQRDGNPAFLQRYESLIKLEAQILRVLGAESQQAETAERPPEKLVVGVRTSELV